MTRVQWLLIGVVVAELAVGGGLVMWRLSQPTPPLPNLAAVDPLTAGEIRTLAANCRTAGQWAELGEVYLATGYFPEAEACLREASALDPGDGVLAFKHGFALERLGMLEETNAKYEAAAGRNRPRQADCWYYVGKNHLRGEQESLAAAAFERAGSLPGARFELALLDARAGRLTEAETKAGRLSEEFPDAYPPVSLRYRLALARNDRTEADHLADLFERKPRPLPTPFETEVDWVFGLAKGLGRDRLFRDAGREMQAGRVESVEKKLRSALEAGWNPEIADKLAETVFVLRRPGEAAEVLAEAVDRGRPSFELLWRLGQAQDALGQPTKALELWERAARTATGPAAQDLWHDLAERYDQTGDHAKAKVFHARAYTAAGREALDAGRPNDAVQALTRAVAYDPELAHAWYLLGEAYRFSDQPAEARAAYERCLQTDPDHGRASRALKILGK